MKIIIIISILIFILIIFAIISILLANTKYDIRFFFFFCKEHIKSFLLISKYYLTIIKSFLLILKYYLIIFLFGQEEKDLFDMDLFDVFLQIPPPPPYLTRVEEIWAFLVSFVTISFIYGFSMYMFGWDLPIQSDFIPADMQSDITLEETEKEFGPETKAEYEKRRNKERFDIIFVVIMVIFVIWSQF